MSEPLRFQFPLPPNIANAKRRSWKAAHFGKVRYYAQCDELQLVKQLPPPPAAPFARATIAVTLTVGSQMDRDNSVSRCKWTIDWLKTRGYIVDDKPKHLTWRGFPRQKVRKSEHGIAIILTPLLA